MAQRTVAAARTTAVLTGGGAVDYCADLDMNNVLDGEVTIEVLPTVALLDTIHLNCYAGPAANPTGPVHSGTDLVHVLTITAVRNTVTIRTNERYFRAGVIGTGAGGPVGSDAVVNYYYKPVCANP